MRRSVTLLCTVIVSVLAVPLTLSADIVFGPKTYTMRTGAPQNLTDEFSLDASLLCDGRAAFTLVVSNGDGAGNDSVSSARVALNGRAILGERHFSPNVSRLEVPFEPAAQNRLHIELKGGRPGSALTLSVRRDIDEPLFPAVTYTLTERPQTFAKTVTVADTAEAFILVVRNGDSAGQRRVDHATVSVNGKVVLRDHELAESATGILRIPVPLGLSNALSVHSKGDAGDLLTVGMVRRADESVCAPEVFFSTPADDDIVDTTRILVTGTVVAPRDVGVTVNGYVAEIDFSSAGTRDAPFRWAVLVDAASGPLELRAVATDGWGARGEARRNIFFSPRPETLELSADGAGATVPITVTYSLRGAQIKSLDADLDGDGNFEITGSTAEELSKTYVTPGLYIARVRATTVNGALLYAATPVPAHSFSTLHSLLQKRWTSFTGALAASNVEAALQQLAPSARAKYEPALRLIRPSLPQFAAGLETIHPVWIRNGAAHYLLTRIEGEKTRGYYIYFVRDANGVWKLVQF